MSENKRKLRSPPPPTPEHNDKDTLAGIDSKITEVKILLLNGYTRSEIHDYALKKEFCKSIRQVDVYIKRATELIKEHNLATFEENMSLVMANLWDLYKRTKASGKLRDAHGIIMSIAKLKGLEEHVVVIKDERELKDVSDDELESMLFDKES